MIKKISLTLTMLLSLNLSVNSQTLEIIDAIAGTLLPKVVDGIKQIKDSGNKNTVKVDRTTFNGHMDELNKYMTGITGAISSDAESLKTIGELASTGAQLYDNLGAMYAMSNRPLIEKIIDCNCDDVQRAYAQAFYRDLQQLRKDVGKLQTDVPNLNIDKSLKDDLAQKVNSISSDNTDLQSYLATSGIETPSSTSTPAQLVNYLEKVRDAGTNLDNLKRSIQGMLDILSSRLGTYVNNASKAKTEVDAKFKEITEQKKE